MEDVMDYLVLIGRILYSSIFIFSSLNHFSKHTMEYAANKGVPLPQIFVPIAGILLLLGGLSVLLGYAAKSGAWLLIVFLVPVTFMMHDFWDEAEPAARQNQRINFMKNCALLGAAFLIAYFGSGPLSIR